MEITSKRCYMTYKILTDSSIDMNRSFLKDIDVGIINYKYDLDGKCYPDDSFSLSYEDFYQALDQGKSSKTSAINTLEYIEFFETYLMEDLDILYIGLSSQLSSSFNNALKAKEELNEKYPERKIVLVDSRLASSSVGLIIKRLNEFKVEGKSLDFLSQWVEGNKQRFQTWISSTDLSFLLKGGRLSKAFTYLDSAIKICPLLTINYEGKLSMEEKYRSKKKAYQHLIDLYDRDGIKDKPLIISYSASIENAEYFKEILLKRHPEVENLIHIDRIGTTIGSHTGPTTLIFCFESQKDIGI